MLGSLIFVLSWIARRRRAKRVREPLSYLGKRCWLVAYSLTTRAILRYCVGAMPTCAEKKCVKWLCDEKPSSKPMSVTDVCEQVRRSSARSMRMVLA